MDSYIAVVRRVGLNGNTLMHRVMHIHNTLVNAQSREHALRYDATLIVMGAVLGITWSIGQLTGLFAVAGDAPWYAPLLVIGISIIPAIIEKIPKFVVLFRELGDQKVREENISLRTRLQELLIKDSAKDEEIRALNLSLRAFHERLNAMEAAQRPAKEPPAV